MSRRLGFEEAAADHRGAIDEVVRAIEAVDVGAWATARLPGKWSPAEIAQHLVLSYERRWRSSRAVPATPCAFRGGSERLSG